MWTEEKRGVIGCKFGVKRGSIDRHSIFANIWECPPGFKHSKDKFEFCSQFTGVLAKNLHPSFV